ncbi:MAG: HD domain-containing protein [Candidatus Thorarchaeota archaeon]|jgi:putative hydrolase of HD superfamily
MSKSDIDRLAKQINFIVEIDKLKTILRQTGLVDRSRQENVSEHSWHIAVMAFILAEYSNESNLDILRVIKMLLVHDLVEIDAGDTFLYDANGNHDKHEREHKAAERIFGLLPDEQAEELRAIWEEFEAHASPESKFARALDSLQPVLMAFYNEGWSWKKHGLVKSQILEKKKPIEKGSKLLWKYTKSLLNQAVENDYIIDG